MLTIQLDDRALFLARWRELLLATSLTPGGRGDDPRRRPLAAALVRELGRPGRVESVGYRIVRAFRLELARPGPDAP